MPIEMQDERIGNSNLAHSNFNHYALFTCHPCSGYILSQPFITLFIRLSYTMFEYPHSDAICSFNGCHLSKCLHRASLLPELWRLDFSGALYWKEWNIKNQTLILGFHFNLSTENIYACIIHPLILFLILPIHLFISL